MKVHAPFPVPRTPFRREEGNAFIVVVIFVAIFSIIVGACYVLSDETGRRNSRESRFVSAEVAADAALDVIYGRFCQWVTGHVGVTPSSTDIANSTTYGTNNATFAPIAPATPNISFTNLPGLSNYQVASMTLTPLYADDSSAASPLPVPQPSPARSPFPNASTSLVPGTNTFNGAYPATVAQYFTLIPNIYDSAQCTGALTYKATVQIAPAGGVPATGDSLHPGTITVSRYFQSSQVSPFSYNVFTEGSFEDYDWGQSFDSEASIYASVQVKMDHKGTIINGPIAYGQTFVDPYGNVNGTNNYQGLTFEDPNNPNLLVDPSQYLRQVSKIEVVPDIIDVIAHNNDGSRSASAETATATADDFSRRELIEPPVNLSNDTAPQQVAQRRIYTQADLRLKMSVGTRTITIGRTTYTYTAATGTFYNLDGSIRAQYTGIPTNATSTNWTLNSGGDTVTAGVINAVNVNPVNSNAPFYDPTRTYDTTSNYTGQAGQPSSTNSGSAVESVDVNVGTLTSVINANQSTFANNTVYIWDDGSSGQKNGVRLYDGGILPTNGLTVGSTNPVYIKGDYNTGTVLPNPTDINSANSATLPQADITQWNGGNMVSTSDRSLPTYTPRPSGVFGDTVTTLSQNWRDASSNTGTQYACSTTYNTVMGFGSGDSNALLPDDSFTNGYYATVQTLEMWNNARWNQLGEQMALYHSLYNKHRTPPSWVTPGNWAVIQNDFNAGTAHLPLKWGYLVFSRGRLVRN